MSYPQQDINAVAHTVHFLVGNIGGPATAAPGVATPAAMAFFGQLNIDTSRRIAHFHIHAIEGGNIADVLEVELWRRRGGVLTLLATNTYVSAGADFATSGTGFGSEDLRALFPGDYLFAQATTNTALGAIDGITVDVHFNQGTGPS